MPSRWWTNLAAERYWLETTDRPDLGVDLNAPQLNEEGRRYWSYDFVREVAHGDVVFHYETPREAITSWSRAVGEAYDDQVVWGAHGQASGRGPVAPYPRPGWRRALEGPFPLAAELTLRELQAREPAIRAVHDALRDQAGGSIYFPFQLSASRPMRGAQAYLTKIPLGLIDALPELRRAADRAAETEPTPGAPAPAVTARREVGVAYEPEDENVTTLHPDAYYVDPDVVDRGLRGHRRTQNALAEHIRTSGWSPRRHAPGEPTFDLAWERDEVVYVAEIKSLTPTNEERQLRLGLGQVLRYSDLLAGKGRPVASVLAVERQPSDASWPHLCERLGVRLTWPPFDALSG